MTAPKLCPLLMQGVVQGIWAGNDPPAAMAAGWSLDPHTVGCIGSRCAWWDAHPNGPSIGRCGQTRGLNFPDPAWLVEPVRLPEVKP